MLWALCHRHLHVIIATSHMRCLYSLLRLVRTRLALLILIRTEREPGRGPVIAGVPPAGRYWPGATELGAVAGERGGCAGRVVPHSESIVNPGLAGYGGALYDAWTPDIEGSPIDYAVHS
jgi:hypothetical protein